MIKKTDGENVMEERYVAYVSTYTKSGDKGIRIYDVDVKAGRLSEREQVTITNSSYVTISHNQKFVYSITDMGVEAFKIQKDGGLKSISSAGINGMRGCYLSTDYTDSFLFVAGYHDGKITVLRLNADGTVGEICDEIFHQGVGTVTERTFTPHVSCVKMTRDNKYLCAADMGIDHIKVYKLDHETGKLKIADIVRCEQGSAPRLIKFRGDGKYAYVLNQLHHTIEVYDYHELNGFPEFTRIQQISTANDYHTSDTAAYALKFSRDFKYLFCSNAGDNSVGAYSIDAKTGILKKLFILPVSGDFPKDVAIFPDTKHLISLNHESDTMSFFDLDLKNNVIIMNGPMLKVPKGNCIIMKQL
ncbi:MAG: lactonase family protein [Lachnospiraceae bacterium]|nr:lactonase family protein [Lachnospiraceae bacterium]